MFLHQLNPALFTMQAAFMKAMDTNRDCMFWAETLIVEETKELNAAMDNNEGLAQIIHEAADVLYVVCGFYNAMPKNIRALISAERFENLTRILDEAAKAVAKASMTHNISLVILEEAFERIHESNMSKLDDEGKPIRREDGKILKGPNYKKPDMAPVVQMHLEFLKQEAEEAQANLVAATAAEAENQTKN